ncbi:hypothetical protein C7999DRAFT_16403 [Corynascus novoguineensis]|uniref:Uncharacterized protein n=1 Tax=Corynascus novoguineensis TaxID=1126955 RepID=A0AAN7CNG7_9PEZI|nr:hypothetical protein C7999DRAFT_16403 [Corynascus novoguineensis]
MSSTTSSSALSRARSLRKPSKAETTSSSGEVRNVSPSRLPVKGQSTTRTTRSATTSSGATKSSRPLSGVFSRISSTSSRPREKESSPGPEASPPSRLTRATSVRQSSTSIRPSTGTPTTRPTTSSGVPASRRAASGAGAAQGSDAGPGIRHTRAKSSVTTLSSTSTLRPPSQTFTTSSSTTLPDRSRPPLTSLTRRTPASGATPPSPTGTTTPRRPLSLSSLPGAPKPSQPSRQLNKPLPRPPSQSSTTTTTSSTITTPTYNNTTITTTTTTTNTNNNDHKSTPTRAPTTATARTAAIGGAKPAFTTHQQSFTPLKPPAPKLPTAAFLAPPSPSKLPGNVALSAETARLQTELLQLHLLHRAYYAADTGTGQAWAGSAKAMLGKRFEKLRAEAEAAAAEEAGAEEERAIAILRKWGGTGARGGPAGGLLLEDKVAGLDAVLTGLWGVIGEPGGRYERLVRGFEGWLARVEGIVERRRRWGQTSSAGEGSNSGNEAREGEREMEADEEEGDFFIPSPSAAWKAEHAALLRRADEWCKKLDELGDVPPPEEGESPSNLGRILAGCRALVDNMLAELEFMEQIEQEAAADEMAWVRDMNRRELGGKDEETPRPTAGAIWRVL